MSTDIRVVSTLRSANTGLVQLCETKAGRLALHAMKFFHLAIALGLTVLRANATVDNERFDCLPGLDATEAACKSRGCIWELPNSKVVSRPTSSYLCYSPCFQTSVFVKEADNFALGGIL